MKGDLVSLPAEDQSKLYFGLITSIGFVFTLFSSDQLKPVHVVLVLIWLVLLTVLHFASRTKSIRTYFDYLLIVLLLVMGIGVARGTSLPLPLAIVPAMILGLCSPQKKIFPIIFALALPFIFLVDFSSWISSLLIAATLLSGSWFLNSVYVRPLILRGSTSDSIMQELAVREQHMIFTTSIMEGKFAAESPFAKDDGLGNLLFSLALKLKDSREQESARNWQMSGLNELGALLRSSSGKELDYQVVLSFLVKYIHANQGGLFILEGENNKQYLELKGCYAYEKNRVRNMRIDVDQGLLGQAILEREIQYIERIPENYVHITSGLGIATPRSLVIVPLQHTEIIVGAIELASFKTLDSQELLFLRKVGEIIGSAIYMERARVEMEKTLADSQQLAEELRSQQEEVRQNMEELEATQEHLTREAKERENLQNELSRSKEFLNLVIDSVPIPIFVKDRQHRMVLLNRAVCNLNGKSKEEMLGKTDYDFFTAEEASVFWDFEEEIFSKHIVAEKVEHAIRDGKETYTLDKKLYVKTDDGEEFLVGINIDVTDTKKMEKQMASELNRT